MKILLTRLSSIGDIVLATSILKPLRERYPEGEVVMVVKTPFLPLLGASSPRPLRGRLRP